MIVVSDTSPIINLAAVGQLELLHKIYGEIAIPQAVYHEIVVIGAGQPGATEVIRSCLKNGWGVTYIDKVTDTIQTNHLEP
jgi:predicted nucleic acid-binding protein